ncbi:prepilin-type N-terminal cleavage/methylation domain-containing protein [Thalassotalea piscium]|uniref:Prepilin-type N-terminal cleavage/methylation domain-containing protein n=1 Tax=Thalassotalea piscium TaxID=1230533 RepID=A0A7X0NFZ7_9GAMM|nr:prepilin-type N-terminal cleavage/methylation domain-containing protein [Thalassotalea piscium]MBB6542767.1 prepilin-type N-terminal cleavage/methylation domain-containing protein [Thalassotalea piscium]
MTRYLHSAKGFTLIELMIVMSIVALIMGMVGPLAINSLEKAEAKQEMLTLKNWLKRISYRAYATGQQHQLALEGKRATLTVGINNQSVITVETFESIFFEPQIMTFNTLGIISPSTMAGEYKGEPMSLNLKSWVNGEEEITYLTPSS